MSRPARLDPTSPLVGLLLAWHGLAVLLALVVDPSMAFVLGVWTVVAVVVRRVQPGPFLPAAMALAVAEETLVYAFGGGLQGAATSLLDDYVHALPVFAGFVLGWWLACRRYDVPPAALAVLAGLHGFLLEIVLQGHWASPAATFLLGGPTLFVYASVVVTVDRPQGPRPFTRRAMLASWMGVLVAMVVGAVVADNLAALVGV